MRKEKMNMELRDYRVQPDEGVFEQIEHRLRVRRAWRIGGMVAAMVTVAVAVVTFTLIVVGRPPVDTRVEAPVVAKTLLPTSEGQVVMSEEQGDAVTVDDQKSKLMRKPTVPQAQELTEEIPVRQAVVKTVISQPEQETAPTVYGDRDAERMEQTRSIVERSQKTVELQQETSGMTVDAPTDQSQSQPAAKAEVDPVVPVHYDNIVWAPNAIAPNGDVDENRTFSFKYTSEVSQFRIFIYNRGGRRVFSSSNPEFVWDGSADGTALPQGAYVWVARFRDSSGRQREEKGSVIIVR